MVSHDFRSKQIMLMVHIWMMHKKLISEGDDGHVVQECLFDELWEDTSNRIRGAGISELSVSLVIVVLWHVLNMKYSFFSFLLAREFSS